MATGSGLTSGSGCSSTSTAWASIHATSSSLLTTFPMIVTSPFSFARTLARKSSIVMPNRPIQFSGSPWLEAYPCAWASLWLTTLSAAKPYSRQSRAQ